MGNQKNNKEILRTEFSILLFMVLLLEIMLAARNNEIKLIREIHLFGISHDVT